MNQHAKAGISSGSIDSQEVEKGVALRYIS
jgi:hypothetical protein